MVGNGLDLRFDDVFVFYERLSLHGCAQMGVRKVCYKEIFEEVVFDVVEVEQFSQPVYQELLPVYPGDLQVACNLIFNHLQVCNNIE